MVFKLHFQILIIIKLVSMGKNSSLHNDRVISSSEVEQVILSGNNTHAEIHQNSSSRSIPESRKKLEAFNVLRPDNKSLFELTDKNVKRNNSKLNELLLLGTDNLTQEETQDRRPAQSASTLQGRFTSAATGVNGVGTVETERNVSTTAEAISEEAALEKLLPHTCRGMCWSFAVFPCSCSPICELYGTCCEDFAAECPENLMEGRRLYGQYYGSRFQCGEDGKLKISSCPEVPDAWLNYIREGKFNETTLVYRAQEENYQDPELQYVHLSAEAIKRAIAGRPVTDKLTLISFMNNSIFECHVTSNLTLDWTLQLTYTSSNPVTMSELGLADMKNLYTPKFVFNRRNYYQQSCVPDLVMSCPTIKNSTTLWNLDYVKCRQFTWVVRSLRTNKYYRNLFCASCNEGRHEDFEPLIDITTSSHGSELKVLVSLTASGDFHVEVERNQLFFSSEKSIWRSIECPAPDATEGNELSRETKTNKTLETTDVKNADISCKVRCSGSNHFLGSDGRCRANYSALLALTGIQQLERLSNCAFTMQQVTEFLSCNMEIFLTRPPMHQAEFSAPEAFFGYDDINKRDLFITKVNIVTLEIAKYFFVSQFNLEDMVAQIHQIAVIVKALYQYIESQNLCVNDLRDAKESNLTYFDVLVDPRPLNDTIGDPFDINMKAEMISLRGRIADTWKVTTVCLTFVRPTLTRYDLLHCLDDVVYEKDEADMNKVLNTRCSDHLTSHHSRANEAESLHVNQTTIMFHTLVTLVPLTACKTWIA